MRNARKRRAKRTERQRVKRVARSRPLIFTDSKTLTHDSRNLVIPGRTK